MRTSISLALILTLTACGAKTDTAPTTEKQAEAPSGSSTGSVEIGFLKDSRSDVYCTFHANDDASGKQIFITPKRNHEREALVDIGGATRELKMVQLDENSKGQDRYYLTQSGDEVMVHVSMTTGSKDGSTTSYTGSIRVVSPVSGPFIAMSGSCGG